MDTVHQLASAAAALVGMVLSAYEVWDHTTPFALCLFLKTCVSSSTRAVFQLDVFFSCSQVWTSMSQRRGLHRTQQVSLQGRLLRGPVRERRTWRARGRWEWQHTGAHHWHDLLPAGPHQLYCIKSRSGWSSALLQLADWTLRRPFRVRL